MPPEILINYHGSVKANLKKSYITYHGFVRLTDPHAQTLRRQIRFPRFIEGGYVERELEPRTAVDQELKH